MLDPSGRVFLRRAGPDFRTSQRWFQPLHIGDLWRRSVCRRHSGATTRPLSPIKWLWWWWWWWWWWLPCRLLTLCVSFVSGVHVDVATTKDLRGNLSHLFCLNLDCVVGSASRTCGTSTEATTSRTSSGCVLSCRTVSLWTRHRI